MNSTSLGCEVGEDADQVARLLDRRPGGGAHRHAHLVGDDVGERRLAEPGRAVQQHVIERLAALLRGRDRDLQVLADAILADVLVEQARAQPGFVLRVLVDARRGHHAVVRHRWPASRKRLFQHRARSCASEADVASGLDRGVGGFFGERPMIPQVHQRRDAHRRASTGASAARPPAAIAAACARGSRSFSSSTMRSDVFLPTPGIAVSRATSPRSIARIELLRLDARQHRERHLRADAADADQPLEQLLLEQRGEAVQQQRVLAHVRVDAQRRSRRRRRRGRRRSTAARARRSRRR